MNSERTKSQAHEFYYLALGSFETISASAKHKGIDGHPNTRSVRKYCGACMRPNEIWHRFIAAWVSLFHTRKSWQLIHRRTYIAKSERRKTTYEDQFSRSKIFKSNRKTKRTFQTLKRRNGELPISWEHIKELRKVCTANSKKIVLWLCKPKP